MAPTISLLGSSVILTEVIKAAQLLVSQGVDVSVFSVTNWSELVRDGASSPHPFIAQQLALSGGRIIAAPDCLRVSVRAYLPEGRKCVALDTDGFGRSDARAALRAFFGVNASNIVQAAVKLLGRG